MIRLLKLRFSRRAISCNADLRSFGMVRQVRVFFSDNTPCGIKYPLSVFILL